MRDVVICNARRICTNHDNAFVVADIVDGIADADAEFVASLRDGTMPMLWHKRVITINGEDCFPFGRRGCVQRDA